MSIFGGVRVLVSDYIGSRYEQVRFPRSRAKRIRKKWRKDRRNWAVVERPEFYQLADGTVLASRSGYAQLRRMAT